jgi:hypothetical protein
MTRRRERTAGGRRIERATEKELLSRMDRRRFLGAAGGALVAALGGGGYGLWRLLESPAKAGAHAFRSRPDLRPPVATIVRSEQDRPGGYVFVAPLAGPGQAGALILDDDGEPVWFRPSPEGLGILNFRVQRYRGQPVLTWWEGQVGKGFGRGSCVIVGSDYRELTRIRAANGLRPDLHEFLLTDDGTAILVSYRVLPRDLSALGGTRTGRVVEGVVQEVDVATRKVLFEWRSLDHVPLEESKRRAPSEHDALFDYLHLNSVDVDSDGHFLVSARHTWTIYKVHRRTGDVIWRLGGKKNDFRFGPDVRFAWQHDARRRRDGMLSLFDNGAPPKVEPQSRALVLGVDERAMSAELVRSFADGLQATAMGNVQTLADDGVFVGWGTEPVASQFAVDGTRRFEARFPRGARSYRAFRFDWHGEAPGEPAVVARHVGDGSELAVSWNGATDVALWRVSAGPTASGLAVVADVPRSGFETLIHLDARQRYAAVTAIDYSGRARGRSRTITLPRA